EMTIEAQAAESRVAKLSVLESRMLDDRDKARPEKTKTLLHCDGRGEARRVRRESPGRRIEPFAEVRGHVCIACVDNRAVIPAQSAEKTARPAVAVDDDGAHDNIGARRDVAFQPVGRAGPRDVPSIALFGDDAFEPVFRDDLEE